MTDFKLSSKMRLFAIISLAIITIGLVLGTVFHFSSDKFFNYGGEYKSYKSITVNFVYTEFGKKEEIEEICDKAFDDAGISCLSEQVGTTGIGNNIIYKFSTAVDNDALIAAVSAINTKIAEMTSQFNDIPQSRANFHNETAVKGGEKTLIMAAITLSVIIVVNAIYVLIRYKLSAMCAALIAQLHNFALFAAVLALCRIPVTSAVLVYAVLIALTTAVCVTYTLDRINKNRKDSDNSKLSAAEITDLSVSQTFKLNFVFCVFLALAAVLMSLLAIGSMSFIVVLSSVLCAFAAFVVSFYGSVIFAPSVYPYFKNVFVKRTEKPLNKKNK